MEWWSYAAKDILQKEIKDIVGSYDESESPTDQAHIFIVMVQMIPFSEMKAEIQIRSTLNISL